jgi:hypothetical protein
MLLLIHQNIGFVGPEVLHDDFGRCDRESTTCKSDYGGDGWIGEALCEDFAVAPGMMTFVFGDLTLLFEDSY